MDVLALIEQAKIAMKHAYAPYSNFHVGACILVKDGSYIHGSNVENASYGLSNCAERSALFATYSQGYRKEDIVAMALICDGTMIANPCGACRQVMRELLQSDTPIFLASSNEYKKITILELLPNAFTMEDLNEL